MRRRELLEWRPTPRVVSFNCRTSPHRQSSFLIRRELKHGSRTTVLRALRSKQTSASVARGLKLNIGSRGSRPTWRRLNYAPTAPNTAGASDICLRSSGASDRKNRGNIRDASTRSLPSRANRHGGKTSGPSSSSRCSLKRSPGWAGASTRSSDALRWASGSRRMSTR